MLAALDAFVRAADEVWRLQRGSEPDCVFFQKTVNEGRRITDRGTRQGSWILAPSGKVLARSNTRDPDTVLEMMRVGLERWEELSEADRRLPPGTELDGPRHRWEQNYPTGGLVLERIGRDLDLDGLDGARSDRWNRDHLWFSAGEVATLVPAELAEGARFELPLLADRLGRFTLVDNVRGQTIPYTPGECEAELTAEVVAVDGDWVELELEGRTQGVSDGTWELGFDTWRPNRPHPHGIETRIRGRATWNGAARSFDDLELVAVGRRWGRTDNNARRDPAGLVGFHLEIAPPDSRVAPTFLSVYGADWVTMPDVLEWLESPEECGLTDG